MPVLAASGSSALRADVTGGGCSGADRGGRGPWNLAAVRALGLLAGGVGTDGRPDEHGLGVNADGAVTVDGEREAVEPARRRAALLLADAVVLRSVARALEPLRAEAPRHAAAQVDALLVQGDVALLHAGDDRVGVRTRLHGDR